ncbi:MAG: DUF1501 domain-containing protein [Sphingomonadaceae bacterium]
MIDRRQLLASGILATGALYAPRIAFAAAPGDRRFVFIIQRGAADGLATLAPVGDPAYAALRGRLADEGGAKLDSMFVLHPALRQIARLHAQKQALFLHAVASPYRERSHFDGQNVLETGGAAPYRVKDGWMNRLLDLIPADDARAIAVAVTVPVALRGPAPVSSYAPSKLPSATDDLLMRVGMLYEGDPLLGPLWSQAMATRDMAADVDAEGNDAAATGALAASLLAPADGARIAMIETGGWDTHANQKGRLSRQLNGLDRMIAALKEGLGSAWSDTLIVVATEFGRTAAANGTGGTDHGTASAAMLIGGPVAGGRVIADWPGLRQADLHQGRDLKPTLGLDAAIASALAQHYGLDYARALPALFPGASRARQVEGLLDV